MNREPKLRFKEFCGEWEEKRLEEIAEISSGLTPLRSELKYYINPTIPWIKTTDLNNSYIETTEEKINEITLKETSLKLLPKDTLLIAMYGGFNQIGRTGLTTIESTTNQALSAIKFNNKNISSFFFLNFFNCKVNVWKRVSASSRKDPNITKKDIESFKVYYPDYKEQQKIADFLSSVDKKISITEEKLDLFKEYKKGIMQKIFNQELRFKDSNGNDYPEWEEKRLEKFLIEYNEKTTINNQYSTISSTATGIYLQEEYFNRQIASSDNTGYKILNKNQLVFSPQNLWLGNININLKYEKGIVSPSYKIFDINENFILINYFKHILKTSRMLEKYKNASEQGASIVRRNLDMKQFLEIKIDLPCLEEQQKIADFLSSIDNKIDSLAAELENLKEFKKGLLQQMFV